MMGEWYEEQRRRDELSRQQSEALLGPEGQIFARYMALTVACLDAITYSDRLDELAVKRGIEFSSHALSLNWSAWDEALCGRYDASRGHSRSSHESGEYLMALLARPDLADDLGSNTKDIRKARRLVKEALDSQEAGRGEEYLQQVRQFAKSLQPLAHVCHEVAGTLPMLDVDGRGTAVVRPGGMISPATLRLLAIPLAIEAIQLYTTTLVFFSDIVDPEGQLWRDQLAEAKEALDALAPELDGMRNVLQPVAQIYFARSDENVGVQEGLRG